MTSTAVEIQLRQQAAAPKLQALADQIRIWQSDWANVTAEVFAEVVRRRRKRHWQQRRRPGARFSTFQPTTLRWRFSTPQTATVRYVP